MSVKCRGRALFVLRCLAFETFVTSCPYSTSAHLISCISVEGCRFGITTRKLLSCRGLYV